MAPACMMDAINVSDVWWRSGLEDQGELEPFHRSLNVLSSYTIKTASPSIGVLMVSFRHARKIYSVSWGQDIKRESPRSNNKNVRNLWNISAYYCSPNDYFMHEISPNIDAGRLCRLRQDLLCQRVALLETQHQRTQCSHEAPTKKKINPKQLLLAFFGFWGSRRDILRVNLWKKCRWPLRPAATLAQKTELMFN